MCVSLFERLVQLTEYVFDVEGVIYTEAVSNGATRFHACDAISRGFAALKYYVTLIT
jgi:hypothetical protein